MARFFFTGVGIAMGIALWPVMLPLLAVVAIFGGLMRGKRTPAAPQASVTQASGDVWNTSSLLENERVKAMAIVDARNREYLERCYRD